MKLWICEDIKKKAIGWKNVGKICLFIKK
jgi:hypothetical protein